MRRGREPEEGDAATRGPLWRAPPKKTLHLTVELAFARPPAGERQSVVRTEFVKLLLAEPEAVLVSKALKAPSKNRPLLTEYLARIPSARFWELAKRYALNVEQFT